MKMSRPSSLVPHLSTKDALLEIGSEELPASFVLPGIRQLKALAEESLKASGLSYSSIEAYGTPRRLAVVIHGLSDRSSDQKKVVTGPPSAIAKDAQGQWTSAALGFARKQGLKPSELTIEKDRLSATLQIKGVATRQLLADLFPQWITRLEFPKSMVWEPTKFHYPRPIRWLAAVYGNDTVSFTLAGVRSGKWTYGLMLQSTKKIPITQPGKYVVMRKNQCVLVEPQTRQEAIRRFAEQAVKRVHGKVHMSAALLEEVGNLVEHPVAILGNFDPAYLDLPKEVLITCLEHHQKFFPVVEPHPMPSPSGRGASEAGGEAKLLPHFVGIRNGMSVHQEIVREGYERVLAARLADARFFFNQDRRTPLAAKVDALRGVMFQEKLGNLFEKKERVKKLLGTLAPAMGGMADLEKAQLAANLCKADLVTDMVREFPELQGIMARLYAQADGEDAGVAQALEEHYWPITLSGTLPSSDIAAFVALADKLDTLAGDFAVGLIPSGSADPYGLRRAAVGIIRILESKKWPLNLEWLVDQAVEAQPNHLKAAVGETQSKLNQFMQQRFAALLTERGFKSDEIDAILAGGVGVVREALARLEALKSFRDDKEFLILATVFKRPSNIIRQAKKAGVDFVGGNESSINELLFEHEAERELHRVLKQTSRDVDEKISNKEYSEALKAILPIATPLDSFFKEAMVMADNHDVKLNRLNMMCWVETTLAKVADFSKLQNA